MAVATDVVARRYINITAGTPIPVDYPVYEETDVRVIYGKLALVAILNVDYTVTLDEPNFDTFIITPTASLINKINDLIALDPEETNYIVVRRIMDMLTDSTPSAVRYTPYTSREFDRTALRFQQIQEQLNRSILLGENFIGDVPSLQVTELQPGRALIVDDSGVAIVAGPSSDEIENAQQYAETAGAAAAAAAAAETNAVNAAGIATAAASAASADADAAEDAADAAGVSASNAGASASAAAGSATTASTAATNAGNSATAAAGSASAASSSATAASTAATNAGNYAAAAAQDAADADAARIAAEAAAANASGTIFATRAAAMAATIPASATHLTIKGWYAAGDGGEATYAIRTSNPGHAGSFALSGTPARWAEISMRYFEPRMFGAKSDFTYATSTGTDNKTFLQNMLDTSKAQGGVPMVIAGRYRSVGQLAITDSQFSMRGEWFSGAVIAVEGDVISGLAITQTSYQQGTYVEGITFLSLTKQTAGQGLRIEYSAADSVGNRNFARCVVKGVSCVPRNVATHGFKIGLNMKNVHNATIEEFTATGYRDTAIPQTDPAHWTHMDAGILLQSDTGMTAIPSDLYILNPRIFHALRAISIVGEYEGVRIDNPILVGVSVGVRSIMSSVRPWLQIESGHMNYMTYGVQATNCPQSNFNNLLLYKFQNSASTSYGIALDGCDHSQIEGVRFYNLCANAGTNGEHHGVSLTNSSFCTVDNLVHMNPSRTVQLAGTSGSNRIGRYIRQGAYAGATAVDAVYDVSTGGGNEYGGIIAATKNAGGVTVGGSSTPILSQSNVALAKGDRVRITVLVNGNHGATAGLMFAQLTSSASGGGVGYFGLDAASASSRLHGVTGDWNTIIDAVYSCVTTGTFTFTLQGVSTGSDSTIAAGGAQMTVQRL